MPANNDNKTRGEKNSSITRVRPFFRYLFDQNASGLSWLLKLIVSEQSNHSYASYLASLSCMINNQSQVKRKYKDKILGNIELEHCFECSVPPSYVLLRWLIEHPDTLTWPKHGQKERKYCLSTQLNRENLFCKHGRKKQSEAKQNAINLLDSKGVQGSKRKWWAFEGFTEVDCLLETEDFLLGIEGKRMEKVSSATDWYPQRNQIIRNLEAIKEKAGSKAFAVLLMSEDGSDPILDADYSNSLPLYSAQEISEIRTHYLGAVSWQQACDAVGLDYNELPETIQDVCKYLESSKTNI